MAKKQEETLEKASPAYMMKRDEIKEVMEALAENIGNEQLKRNDFPKIKIPPGDTKFMTLVTAEEPEGEAVRTVKGIIVGNHMARAYWEKGSDASGVGQSPPDCSSDDGVVGIGNPGGDCAGCPMAQFGSDPKGGKAQACKLQRILYLLTPGMVLPTVVQVPPTSNTPARKYLLNLSMFGRPQYTVETEIGFQPKVNGAGQPYNEFTFKRSRFLEGEELEAAKTYSQMFKQLLGDAQDFPEVPEGTVPTARDGYPDLH